LPKKEATGRAIAVKMGCFAAQSASTAGKACKILKIQGLILPHELAAYLLLWVEQTPRAFDVGTLVQYN